MVTTITMEPMHIQLESFFFANHVSSPVGRSSMRQVVDMRTYKQIGEEKLPLAKDESICGLAWCPDGQILTVATAAGDVFNFLTRMPNVHASCGPRVAYLSSLREVSVVDASRGGDKPLTVPVSIEPTIVALGPSHVAVAMNDRVIFFRSTPTDKKQVNTLSPDALGGGIPMEQPTY